MSKTKEDPNRYRRGGLEVWDIERAFFGKDAFVDHLAQGAVEYIIRFRLKNGAADLRKAAHLCIKAAEVMEATK